MRPLAAAADRGRILKICTKNSHAEITPRENFSSALTFPH